MVGIIDPQAGLYQKEKKPEMKAKWKIDTNEMMGEMGHMIDPIVS